MAIMKLGAVQVDQVLELWCSNWVETADSIPTKADRDRIRLVLEKYTTNPNVCCFIAKQGEEIVGFITASLSSHPVMEGLDGAIEELYVLPDYRRQSTGSQLVQATVLYLRQRGAGVVRTNACIDSEAANAFWRSLSWEADLTTFSLYDMGQ